MLLVHEKQPLGTATLWARTGERVRAGENSRERAGRVPVSACLCRETATMSEHGVTSSQREVREEGSV